MLEIALGVAGVLVTVVALAVLAAGIWLRVAGDPEGFLDEEATLDVQNHIGDSRPIR